jgi:hypothetical protein
MLQIYKGERYFRSEAFLLFCCLQRGEGSTSLYSNIGDKGRGSSCERGQPRRPARAGRCPPKGGPVMPS